jgi:pimeloyl-ACP methyl ester carboxylesterase
MNRRQVLAGLATVAMGSAAAWMAKPVLVPRYRKWRSSVRELPLSRKRIAYRDFGEGRPAVVIASGMSVHMENYYDLQRRLAEVTRVISFDRPGIGYSAYNKEPRTLDYIDRDMREFLHALGVPPPYILVGHSLGGHIIRYYADRHPDEVAGLVFLDHPHEDWFRYIRGTWSEEQIREYFVWWNPVETEPGSANLEERRAYEANCDMIRGVAIPPDVPVLMFTADNAGHYRKSAPGQAEDRSKWVEMQASLLVGVKDAKHIVNLEVGHMLHRDRPEWVASEIGAFIRKVRAQTAALRGAVSPPSPSPGAATAAAVGSLP